MGDECEQFVRLMNMPRDGRICLSGELRLYADGESLSVDVADPLRNKQRYPLRYLVIDIKGGQIVCCCFQQDREDASPDEIRRFVLWPVES